MQHNWYILEVNTLKWFDENTAVYGIFVSWHTGVWITGTLLHEVYRNLVKQACYNTRSYKTKTLMIVLSKRRYMQAVVSAS